MQLLPLPWSRSYRRQIESWAASLDAENETALQSALSRLIQKKTVPVIAHRMRTVAGADKIVVLSATGQQNKAPWQIYLKRAVFIPAW